MDFMKCKCGWMQTHTQQLWPVPRKHTKLSVIRFKAKSQMWQEWLKHKVLVKICIENLLFMCVL